MQNQPSDKLLTNILKTEGHLNRRQLASYKRFVSMEALINTKYPEYVMKAMNHEEPITAFLSELDTFSDFYSEDKKYKNEFFIRKTCQNLFTNQQKECLDKMLKNQYGNSNQQTQDESGTKKLYNLLIFIFANQQESQ